MDPKENPEIKPLPNNPPISIPPEITPEKEEEKPYIPLPEIEKPSVPEISPDKFGQIVLS